MKYAVIRTGGKQYRVSEGQLVKVEKLAGAVGDTVTLADVLFIGGNGEVKIGSPLVSDAKVTGEIVSQARAKKILVFKKKRRKELQPPARSPPVPNNSEDHDNRGLSGGRINGP